MIISILIIFIVKKFYFLISLFVIFFIFIAAPVKVNADLLYSDPILGTVGQAWSPAGWSVHAGQAVFGTDGALGLFDYSKDFTTNNVIIKFDFNIHDAKTNLVFACRATDDYSSVEQPQFTGNGVVNSLHTSNMTQCINNSCNGTGTVNPYTYSQSVGKHTIELDCLGDTAVLKYDNQVLTTAFMDPGVNGYAVRLYSSGNNNSLDSISNLEVCDSNGCPSNSPTPTPTPTLPPVHLAVPLVKQTANPWQSQVYDSANSWAPNSPTINSWGCALTSAAMVFQYNGIQKMPNGADLNPGTMNAWLKSQPDGYLRNGLVNWLALQRLSQLIKLAFNNPNYTADALEWKWLSSNTNTQVLSDLQNNLPDILSEPGHFIVSTGTQGSTYTINDPYYPKTLLTDYGDTFNYGGQFKPSHTDLSYVMLVGDSTVNFSASDGNGNPIGQQIDESPIQNPSDLSQTSGEDLHVFYIPQPQDGNYTVQISGNSNQNVSISRYVYDEHGNVSENTVNEQLNSTGQKSITIPSQKISFTTLLSDIQNLYSIGEISKGGMTALNSLARSAQKSANKHNKFAEKVQLQAMLFLVRSGLGLHITPGAQTFLEGDINALLGTL